MRVEEAERLLHRIQRRYNREPEEEWRVLLGRDRAGRITQIIADSKNSWQIKGEMINPRKFAGVGLELKGISSQDLLDFGEPFYGVRPIGRDTLSRMLQSGVVPKEILSLPRTPLKAALASQAVVEGPILQSRSPISPISDKQKELEALLNRGLENLMRKKYPETRYAYG